MLAKYVCSKRRSGSGIFCLVDARLRETGRRISDGIGDEVSLSSLCRSARGSERSFSSGDTISAGIFLDAAVDGLTSCSSEGFSCKCADCTILASSVAIVIYLAGQSAAVWNEWIAQAGVGRFSAPGLAPALSNDSRSVICVLPRIRYCRGWC